MSTAALCHFPSHCVGTEDLTQTWCCASPDWAILPVAARFEGYNFDPDDGMSVHSAGSEGLVCQTSYCKSCLCSPCLQLYSLENLWHVELCFDKQSDREDCQLADCSLSSLTNLV